MVARAINMCLSFELVNSHFGIKPKKFQDTNIDLNKYFVLTCSKFRLLKIGNHINIQNLEILNVFLYILIRKIKKNSAIKMAS